ncbi:MAG TPA: GNAT family N-acetyltransferase [Hyphomonadaceae bacterium]|nr:GNAT family N-acetyltransferase [Hyphomonadaceae bacterium]
MSALARSRAPSAGKTQDRVAIRAATPADAAALQAIETTSFTQDRISPRAMGHHLRSDTADVLLATLGAAPAGYALLLYRSTSTLARLYSIATLPVARGKGVGRRLMDALERSAMKRGCDRLRLEVREKNRPAIALYESLGYRRIGRYENYYQDGAPALRFEKQLALP